MSEVERAYRIFRIVNELFPMPPRCIVMYAQHNWELIPTFVKATLPTVLYFSASTDRERYVIERATLSFDLIQRSACFFQIPYKTKEELVEALFVTGEFELYDKLVEQNVLCPSRTTILKAIMVAGTNAAYERYEGGKLYTELVPYTGWIPDKLFVEFQKSINETRCWELNGKWTAHLPPPFSLAAAGYTLWNRFTFK